MDTPFDTLFCKPMIRHREKKNGKKHTKLLMFNLNINIIQYQYHRKKITQLCASVRVRRPETASLRILRGRWVGQGTLSCWLVGLL